MPTETAELKTNRETADVCSKAGNVFSQSRPAYSITGKTTRRDGPDGRVAMSAVNRRDKREPFLPHL